MTHLGQEEDRPQRRRRRIYATAGVAALVIAAGAAAGIAFTNRTPTDQPPPEPVDTVGQRACDQLLDPARRLLIIDAGMTDDQVGDWGGEVYRVAVTASAADTAAVADAGGDILDHMPDLSFQVPQLLELAWGLAEQCVASGLADGRQLHDATTG